MRRLTLLTVGVFATCLTAWSLPLHAGGGVTFGIHTGHGQVGYSIGIHSGYHHGIGVGLSHHFHPRHHDQHYARHGYRGHDAWPRYYAPPTRVYGRYPHRAYVPAYPVYPFARHAPHRLSPHRHDSRFHH